MSSYWPERTSTGWNVICEFRGVVAEDCECRADALAYIAEFEAADAAEAEEDDEDFAPVVFEMARAA